MKGNIGNEIKRKEKDKGNKLRKKGSSQMGMSKFRKVQESKVQKRKGKMKLQNIKEEKEVRNKKWKEINAKQ